MPYSFSSLRSLNSYTYLRDLNMFDPQNLTDFYGPLGSYHTMGDGQCLIPHLLQRRNLSCFYKLNIYKSLPSLPLPTLCSFFDHCDNPRNKRTRRGLRQLSSTCICHHQAGWTGYILWQRQKCKTRDALFIQAHFKCRIYTTNNY